MLLPLVLVPAMVASCSSFSGDPATEAAPDGGTTTLPDGAPSGSSDGSPSVARRIYVLGGSVGMPFGGQVTAVVHSATIDAGGALGTWREETRLPAIRTDHAVAAIGRTLVIIGGGSSAGPATAFYLGSTVRDDGVLSGWQDLGIKGAATLASAATDGRFIHVLGGERDPVLFDTSTFVTELRNAAAPTQTTTTALPTGRRQSAAVMVGDQLFSIGGNTAESDAATASAVYSAHVGADGNLDAWSAGPSLPTALNGHAAVTLGSDVYVIGGSVAGNPTANVVRATKGAGGGLGAWTPVTALPKARTQHCAVVAGNAIYVIGGMSGIGAASSLDEVAVGTVDPGGTLVWKTIGAYPDLRYGAACTVL